MSAFTDYRDTWYFAPNGADYEYFVSRLLDEADPYDEEYGWSLDKAIDERLGYDMYLIDDISYRCFEDSLDPDVAAEYVIGLHYRFDEFHNAGVDLDDYARSELINEHSDCFGFVVMKMFDLGLYSDARSFLSDYSGYDDLADLAGDLADFDPDLVDTELTQFISNLLQAQYSGITSEDEIESIINAIVSAKVYRGDYEYLEVLLQSFGNQISMLESHYNAYIAGVPLEDIFI